MSLTEYKRKRKFEVTSEPSGKVTNKSGNSFVIQKHAATRLHYDFRLEHKGVLKSWAVPHGPSLDPTVKSLAVRVEDHPVEYASFEGTIPKGQYGGGTVMVWDQGTWQAENEASDEDDIDRAFNQGKITFRLFGEKLRGTWSLVQMKSRGEDNWLLLKRNDEFAVDHKKYDVLTEQPRSVLSGRDLSQIADGEKPVRRKANSSRKSSLRDLQGNLSDAPSGTLPEFIKPQLATLADKIPTDDQWIHEIKLDGYRILTRIERGSSIGDVRLFTRSGLDWTDRFSVIAQAVARLPLDHAWLDGEVVALSDAGISDFQQLQTALSAKDASSLVYYVFDLPWAEGKDLTRLPLVERKQVLSQLFEGQHHAAKTARSHAPKGASARKKHAENTELTRDIVRYHEHILGSGKQLLGKACGLALEGLVAKRVDSRYVSQRSDSWLKVKCEHNQEFIVCGYTDPEGERSGFGALLLGYYEHDQLVYCGRVGTGFDHTSLRQLLARFKKLVVSECPFNKPPTRAQQRGVHWLEPTLVAEISYATRTADGLLRQAVFHGVREDKPAVEVTLEKPKLTPRKESRTKSAATTAAVSTTTQNSKPTKKSKQRSTVRQVVSGSSAVVEGVEITHPQRVIYEGLNITKLQLAQYLSEVASWILPGIQGRPLTLLRCPSGVQGKCFYQKHLDEKLPEGVRGVVIKEGKQKSTYPVVENICGLIELAQRSVIEFHPWPAKADDVEHPDQLVFDLDPGEDCPWKWVVQAAHDLRAALEQVGLVSFPRTSGGKGLHVVVPLNAGSCSWEELKEFSSLVAHSFAQQYPKRYVATISKAARRGKVFIDYLRNQRGATAIGSYSPRARASAGVAMPISWRQLTASLQSDQFTVQNVPKKLLRRKADPWKEFGHASQALPKL